MESKKKFYLEAPLKVHTDPPPAPAQGRGE